MARTAPTTAIVVPIDPMPRNACPIASPVLPPSCLSRFSPAVLAS